MSTASINASTAQQQIFGTSSNEDVPVINIAMSIKGASYNLPLAVYGQTYGRTKAKLDSITGTEKPVTEIKKSEALSVSTYLLQQIGNEPLKNAVESALDAIYEIDPGPRQYEDTHFYDVKITSMECDNADISKFLTNNASTMQAAITRSVSDKTGEIVYKCRIDPNTQLAANVKNVITVFERIQL